MSLLGEKRRMLMLTAMSGVIGYPAMKFINSNYLPNLEARLRQNASYDSLKMAKVNQHRLAEYLGELQRKEDTNDRYVAALRGETLTRNPHIDLE
ncbi:hypothetical protein ACB098_11G006200 [Castanea mollissima]